jgi:imidazolonepropionase-like amidohydrolase
MNAEPQRRRGMATNNARKLQITNRKLQRSLRLCLCAFLLAAAAAAQNLSPAVRAFVSVGAPTVALTHVRVIDGTGAPAREDQTVVISGGKIQSVGTAAPPAGAKVMDFAGYSALPGIVGMHDHIFYPTGGVPVYAELAFSAPRLYLAGGVTTIRTTGSLEPYTDLALKKQINDGVIPGPKMFVTGPYLEGAGAYTPQMHELTGPGDARRTVAYWADEGVDNFKAYMHITRAELSAALDEAHKRGLKLTGHLCSIGFREAATLGIDDLEHGLVVNTEFVPGKQPDVCPPVPANYAQLRTMDVNGPDIQQTIKDLVAHHVAVTSTLPVFEISVPGRPPFDTQRAAGAPTGPPTAGRKTYMDKVLDSMAEEPRRAYLTTRARIGAMPGSPWTELFKKEMQFEYAFAKAGGLLLAGLDPTGYGGVVPGFGDHREIELLVEAGFTPLEAIKIATLNGATYLGVTDKIGSIAPGKAADLIVVKGDPSRTISDIENVEVVFKDGIGYDPQKLIDSAKGSVGLH